MNKTKKVIAIVLAVLVFVGSMFGCFYHGKSVGYDEGYDKGHSVGHDEGYAEGYKVGYNKGNLAGQEIGYKDGENAGYDTGFDSGWNVGYIWGIVHGTNMMSSQISWWFGMMRDNGFKDKDLVNFIIENGEKSGEIGCDDFATWMLNLLLDHFEEIIEDNTRMDMDVWINMIQETFPGIEIYDYNLK